MKKSIIIPIALFAAVFCETFLCQRYSLIFRENVSLFLLTPDWLREVFSNPMPLSNLVGSFIGQFYGETILGPMIPAGEMTVIYLCLNALLREFHLPFHNLAAIVLSLTAWILTSSLSSPVAITAILLISLLLWALSGFVPKRESSRPQGKWWEIAAAALLIAGSAVFVSQRKVTKDEEMTARVIVNADKGKWGEVLKIATPESVFENNLMLPYAMLALNNQVRLSEQMFRYPVTGVDCMDIEREMNATGNLFQSFLFESLGVPNEAIHQMFQFSTNFDHGMTHLSLRRLIRLNVNSGNYKMAVKYAEILKHNLFYRYQAKRIIDKYGEMEDAVDSLRTPSCEAPVFSYDPTTDIIQIVKNGNNSPVVVDRLLAYLLLERNLTDFTALFYDYDWRGKKIPIHYQEALLLSGDIREDIQIDPAIKNRSAKGTYWNYYNKQK